jgi:Triose-phosphate Transporter family
MVTYLKMICIAGQVTGIYVKLSLIPVMGGLALCSANELSFNLPGFSASLATNIRYLTNRVFLSQTLADILVMKQDMNSLTCGSCTAGTLSTCAHY